MLVPDLLGYGRTDKPAGYREYKSVDIVGDVLAILSEEGLEKVFVVAHDWSVCIDTTL